MECRQAKLEAHPCGAGVSPSEAVYVGDSPSDGAAAREAGMPCIGVTWGSHKKETLDPAFDQVPQPNPLSPQPSALSPQPSALNPELSTQSPEKETIVDGFDRPCGYK
jgi:ribonucleotide monophosphatase NagD (HAD superfamily)